MSCNILTLPFITLSPYTPSDECITMKKKHVDPVHCPSLPHCRANIKKHSVQSSVYRFTLAFLFVISCSIIQSHTVYGQSVTLSPSSSKVQSKRHTRTIKAVALSTHEKLTIDGKIQEQAWQKLPWSAGFTERQPQPGQASPAWAGIRVLYDAQAIYIAVLMKLLPNEKPSAFEMRRDQGKIWSDDTITVKIDAGLDRRTTLGFVVNSASANLDFIALDNGQVFRLEYDAIWEGRSHSASDHWSVEYRIPFTALAMSPKALRTGSIGFNVTRDHNMRQATDDWQHLPPEFGAFSALHYGTLSGLKKVRGGRPLIFMPYALMGSHRQVDRNLQINSRIGGEIRYGITNSEWLELSILTDFAQVDLDDPLINLDRFALFLPERRPFFTYGLDVFSFGSSGVSQVFFSRRIGLDAQGREIPIYAGAKAYGRRSSIRYGALSVITGENQPLSKGQTSIQEQQKIWSVGRLRYDWGQGSYVGLIAMNRQDMNWFQSNTESEQQNEQVAPALEARDESQFPHYAWGVDTRVRLFDSKLEMSAFYSMTMNQKEVLTENSVDQASANTMTQSMDSSTVMGNNTMSNSLMDSMTMSPSNDGRTLQDIRAGSAAFDIKWRGHNWRPRAQYLWVDQDFNPQMGFVSRRGYHRSNGHIDYLLFRPHRLLRSLTTYVDATKLWNDEDYLDLGYQAVAGMRACQQANWCYSLEFKQQSDVVEEAFSLNQIEIQSGTYQSQHYKLGLRSPRGKRYELSLNYLRQQGYFGGALNQVSWDSSLAFHPTLRWFVLMNLAQFEVEGIQVGDMNASSDLDDMSMGDPSLNTGLHDAYSLGMSTQLLFTPTPKLSLDGVTQVNSDQSTLIWQARLRWRYLSGSDLFVVLRRRQEFTMMNMDHDRQVDPEWRITLKLNFRYDLLL